MRLSRMMTAAAGIAVLWAASLAIAATCYVSNNTDPNAGPVGSDSYSYAQAQDPNTPWATIDKFVNNASVVTGDSCFVKATGTTYTETTGGESGLKPRTNKTLTITGYTSTTTDGGKFVLSSGSGFYTFRFETGFSNDGDVTIKNAIIRAATGTAASRPLVTVDPNCDPKITLENVDFDTSLVSNASNKASIFPVEFAPSTDSPGNRSLTLKNCTFNQPLFTGKVLSITQVAKVTIDGGTYTVAGYGVEGGGTLLNLLKNPGKVEIKGGMTYTGYDGVYTPTPDPNDPNATAAMASGASFSMRDSTMYVGRVAVYLLSVFTYPTMENVTIRGNWHTNTVFGYLVAFGYKPAGASAPYDTTTATPYCLYPVVRNCDFRFVSPNVASSNAEHVLYVSPGSDYGLYENNVFVHPYGGGYGFVNKGDGGTIRNCVIVSRVGLYLCGGAHNSVTNCTLVGNLTSASQSAAVLFGMDQYGNLPTGNKITDCILTAAYGSKYAIQTLKGTAADANVERDDQTYMDHNCYVAGSSGLAFIENNTVAAGTPPAGVAALRTLWASLVLGPGGGPVSAVFPLNDATSIQADPMFVDPVTFNFKIRPQSPCRSSYASTFYNHIGAYPATPPRVVPLTEWK